jgi:hypothetical protein
MLACKDAVLLACSKGWSQVEIETDCLDIVLAWRGEGAEIIVLPVV